MQTETQKITGVAAGVPFVAIPPERARAHAPVVVAWHLLDPPRSETALAAALPLAGLDAWRIYLGLPMCGSRLPEGGLDEVMRLGYEDAVLNLYGPIAAQAAEEFAPAFAALRERFGFGAGPVGLVAASQGSAVAQLVMTEPRFTDGLDVAVAVLVSPVSQLAAVVECMERRFATTYPWSEPSQQVARRLDFVARADEFVGDPAVLLVVGEDDDVSGFREPAMRLRDALARRASDPERVRFALVPGMEHALAEEPGLEPAPQIPAAAEVDRLAVEWFTRHLVG